MWTQICGKRACHRVEYCYPSRKSAWDHDVSVRRGADKKNHRSWKNGTRLVDSDWCRTSFWIRCARNWNSTGTNRRSRSRSDCRKTRIIRLSARFCGTSRNFSHFRIRCRCNYPLRSTYDVTTPEAFNGRAAHYWVYDEISRYFRIPIGASSPPHEKTAHQRRAEKGRWCE